MKTPDPVAVCDLVRRWADARLHVRNANTRQSFLEASADLWVAERDLEAAGQSLRVAPVAVGDGPDGFRL